MVETDAPAPVPSDFDPTDPLKGPTVVPSGGASDTSVSSPTPPISAGALRPIVSEIWKTGHNVVSSFTGLKSVRLTAEEGDSAASASMVLIGPYLKSIKDLPVVLALISLMLLELGVMARAIPEYKALHPGVGRPANRERVSSLAPSTVSNAVWASSVHDELMAIGAADHASDDGPKRGA